MKYFKQWWQKLKTTLEDFEELHLEEVQALKTADPLDTQPLNQKMQSVLARLQNLEQDDSPTPNNVVQNIQTLEQVLTEATTAQNLDQKTEKIKTLLGSAEAYQLLRQTRWPNGIQCADCYSGNVKRLPQRQRDSEYNHRYRCLDCRLEFNDDDGVASGDAGDQPINTWMQCWYLMGCTDSFNYIAHCLGLDLHIVEWMMQRLRTLFQLDAPSGQSLKKQDHAQQSLLLHNKADRQASYESLNANVATVPLDTTEYDRQRRIRLNGSADTNVNHPKSGSTTPRSSK